MKYSLAILSAFILFISCNQDSDDSEKTIQALKWSEDGLIISINDDLKLPEISWPQTLLEYPVDFSAHPVNAEDLILIDQLKNKAVPFQFSDVKMKDGKINTANLCFISNLPSGANLEFHLVSKMNIPEPEEQSFSNAVSVVSEGGEITISNSLLKFRIPASGEYQKMIPPIVNIGNGNQWLGYSQMPHNLPFLKLNVTELSVGPVMAQYQLDYLFEGDKKFQIKILLASEMDFLEIEEDMSGFAALDSLSWNIVWNEFSPQYRYCPNRPSHPMEKGGKGYTNFRWESIGGSDGDPSALKHPELPYDQRNLPDGQLPFTIAPYHNWNSWWRMHTAAFWDEKAGQTVGVFIRDFEKWVDPDYPLWGSKDNLSVHFYYNGELTWSLPLIDGKRSLALAIYPHSKDIDIVNNHNLPYVHVDYLRRWYGWISLNKTKDWILDYGTEKSVHPAFFNLNVQDTGSGKNTILPTLIRAASQMRIASERTDAGQMTPVHNRRFYDHFTPVFENEEGKLSLEDYKKARALYLFLTYIFMDEDLMPMRNLLSGHPNFLADVKGIPGMAAFLFPDHPHAKEMADHFEKFIALNYRYHTRPSEPAWEARGGRWTENLGCYTWAALIPTLKTSFLLHHFYDGKNRILQPNISIYADWLLNSVTSPLDSENGKRVNPPQGAHSNGVPPPYYMHVLGHELQYFDPVLSEHILWLTSVNDEGFGSKAGGDRWEFPVKSNLTENKGTNPNLKSAKYTGYGFNLRKNFGEPDEMYVHLQQIDEGPNYRWGRAAKGGNGVIYYYAAGKRYSHNGIEDVGDEPRGDTERCTNFGVKKEKSYRCIGDYRSVGKNDLTDPLYDFGFAQFASIQANGEAAPEYKSRSILMSGNDYILVLDDVRDNAVEGRLSWTVGEEDDLPFIHQLKPGAKAKDPGLAPVTTYKGTWNVQARYFDGKGDFLTLVTHRENLKPVSENEVYRIEKPDGTTDWIFRDGDELVFDRDGMIFNGSAGIINRSADKKTFEGALFQGRKIGVPGITAQFQELHEYAGISLKNSANGFSGYIQVREETTVQFSIDNNIKGLIFYLNGEETALTNTGENNYSVRVPAGKHEWQWSNNGIIPASPDITRSISGADWCELEWLPVSGATSYSVQKSMNGGTGWEDHANGIEGTKYRISGLAEGKKVHIRVLANAKGGTSNPSGDYPVYPTSLKPHAPEGLIAVKNENEISLSWGQVLGADQYTLYQRLKGSSDFKKIYSGTERLRSIHINANDKIYEFSVTSTNGNGESEKSIIADTDENRLINWYPVLGELFRRDTESQENGYPEYNYWVEKKMPVLKYPFQMK